MEKVKNHPKNNKGVMIGEGRGYIWRKSENRFDNLKHFFCLPNLRWTELLFIYIPWCVTSHFELTTSYNIIFPQAAKYFCKKLGTHLIICIGKGKGGGRRVTQMLKEYKINLKQIWSDMSISKQIWALVLLHPRK